MSLEFEIANDLRTKEAIDVTGRGDFEARPKFFGHDAASNEFAPFEDEHFSSRAGEVSGGHQAVMTCADNDGVVFGTHGGNCRDLECQVIHARATILDNGPLLRGKSPLASFAASNL